MTLLTELSNPLYLKILFVILIPIYWEKNLKIFFFLNR